MPFPKNLNVESWRFHTVLFLAVAVCLGRTWVLWPKSILYPKNQPDETTAAPWWGYVLGGTVALGLFVLMAYFLHFKD